jgi:hypothetical protein
MKVRVQVIIESDSGTTELVQDIVHLERGALQPGRHGLTLAEAKELLQGVQRAMVTERNGKGRVQNFSDSSARPTGPCSRESLPYLVLGYKSARRM